MYNYVFYRNTDITDEQFEDILTGDVNYGDICGKVEHIQKYITKIYSLFTAYMYMYKDMYVTYMYIHVCTCIHCIRVYMYM